MKICKIDGCDRKHHARGWCRMHYKRWCKHGNPLYVYEKPTAEERFWSCVDKKSKHDCWEWTGRKNDNGYGLIYINTKEIRTHRYSWQLHNGEIPEGLFVLHNCFNPSCINPHHLRLGTNKDNCNDWDRTGDRCYNAIVPDCVVRDVVRRYHESKKRYSYYDPRRKTCQKLADELTAFGWPTAKVTVESWVKGRSRCV